MIKEHFETRIQVTCLSLSLSQFHAPIPEVRYFFLGVETRYLGLLGVIPYITRKSP